MLGISNIDYLNKEIIISFSDINLEYCSGSIPVEDKVISLEWKRKGDNIHYLLKNAAGYKTRIDNNSSANVIEMSN